VRCYMAGDRCAGFGHHKVKALIDAFPIPVEASAEIARRVADRLRSKP